MSEKLDRDLGRVEGKLDGIATQLAALSTSLIARDEKVDARFAAHSQRIDSVERKQWLMIGGGTVVAWVFARIDLTKVFALITGGS
jgi:hypothetical protein